LKALEDLVKLSVEVCGGEVGSLLVHVATLMPRSDDVPLVNIEYGIFSFFFSSTKLDTAIFAFVGVDVWID
jgi:hypothetical protein